MDIGNIIDEDDELDEINLIIIYGMPRQVYERADYFHSFDNATFFRRFRITKPTVLEILRMIEDQIEYPYNVNQSVAPVNQLLLFLQFCATGSHLSCIGDFGGVHMSTVSRTIVRVGRALASLSRRFIKMPDTQDEINNTQLNFYEKARFPRVIGAMGCTHVRIQSPGGVDAEQFRNRKGYFSMNVQAISSADLKFMNIVARWPGAAHNCTVFINSRVKQDFENNVFSNSLLLGDSGYALRSYLLTPLSNPTNRAEELFNESHRKTRNAIERLFETWKRRFPLLAYGCRLKLDTVMMLLVATAVLHNICIDNNEAEPPDPDDMQRFSDVMQEDEVPIVPLRLDENDCVLRRGNEIRRNLIDNYFANLDE